MTARRTTLREIDLSFFREGGASPFALLGYRAAPARLVSTETHLDLAFSVTRERVRFLRGNRFVRSRDCRGEPDDAVTAYLMPAIEDGRTVDRVAWHPRSGRIASERGGVGLLGADALREGGEPIPVADDPRAWLAGWRAGICIVDERLARPMLLECGRALQCSDIAHGDELRAMLRKVQVPPILVPAASIGQVAA